MNTNTPGVRRISRLTLVAVVACLLSTTALAQQQPITGSMMDGHPSVPIPAPPSVPVVARTSSRPATNAASPAADAFAPRPARKPADVPAAPADYVSAPTYYAAHVGDTTRQLLRMQASGDRAGPPRPMLGAEASASYQRYLKSFEYPIPEFYEATVGKNATKGR